MNDPRIAAYVLLPFLFVFGCLFLWLLLYGMKFVTEYERIQRWAKKKGLKEPLTIHPPLEEQYEDLQCLHWGVSRQAGSLFEGEMNKRQAKIFRYSYKQTVLAKNPVSFSAVLLHSGFPLKPLFIRPEHLLDKAFSAAGYTDLNFESAEFSNAFYVSSTDRKWAHAALHQAMLEWLLPYRGYCIEFGGQCVIAYRYETFSLDDIKEAIALIEGILDRFPPYLIEGGNGV